MYRHCGSAGGGTFSELERGEKGGRLCLLLTDTFWLLKEYVSRSPYRSEI